MALGGKTLASINYTLIFLIVTCLSLRSEAQTVIWTDNFNNGCASNCLANTYGGWTIIDNDGGTTGGAPNDWFVSCAEEGVAAPGCGSSCIGDASLHIGANPGAGGDMGASFNETGATNATFRMAVSPTISTVGFSTNTLNFEFIAFGSASCSDDRAQLRLSTDNGATWPAGFQYCLNSVCCGACNGYSQGQWTVYNLALPAAFNNNPNVRVGFHWRNNGNGSGTDPSVAIDDISITTVIFPVDLMDFKGKATAQGVQLNWTAARERQLNRYEIQRGSDPSNFKPIASVPGKGQGNTEFSQYAYQDREATGSQLFYRLRMVDENGGSTLSNVIRVVQEGASPLDVTSLLHDKRTSSLAVSLWADEAMKANVEIVDLNGKVLLRESNALAAGENALKFDTKALADGIYFLSIVSNSAQGKAPVKIVRKFQLIS